MRGTHVCSSLHRGTFLVGFNDKDYGMVYRGCIGVFLFLGNYHL